MITKWMVFKSNFTFYNISHWFSNCLSLFSSTPTYSLFHRFFLASFYTKYEPTHFVVNTSFMLLAVVPKLPMFHGVRFFGINKYWRRIESKKISGRLCLLIRLPYHFWKMVVDVWVYTGKLLGWKNLLCVIWPLTFALEHV